MAQQDQQQMDEELELQMAIALSLAEVNDLGVEAWSGESRDGLLLQIFLSRFCRRKVRVMPLHLLQQLLLPQLRATSQLLQRRCRHS